MNCKMSRDEQDSRRRKEKSIPSKHRHFEYKYSDIEQDVLALVDVWRLKYPLALVLYPPVHGSPPGHDKHYRI